MPISVANMVREVSSTGGTGPYSMGGASGRYQTIVDAIGDGGKGYFCAFDDQDFETFIGTATQGSPDTLSRDTILESSNSDAAVDWPASGQRTIVMTAPASKTILADENDDTPLPRDLYLDGAINYDDTDTGSADAYAIQLASTLTAYRDGLLVMFKAANANTGASTLDVNSIGAKNLKRRNGDALASGDIAANDRVIAYYDATDDEFRSINITGDVILNEGTDLPSILSDEIASRPSAGTTGRWFYADDQSRWYRDTGSEWETKGGHLEKVLLDKVFAQTIPDSTSTFIDWGGSAYDLGDFWDPAGDTDRLIMPRDGTVIFSAAIWWDTSGSGHRQISLLKGIGAGQQLTGGFASRLLPVTGTNTVMPATSAPVGVSEGDVFRVSVYQTSGGGENVQTNSWFSAYYIE